MIHDDRHIVRMMDSFGWTGLMRAVQFNNTAIVKIILSTPGVKISVKNIYGMTALHYACEKNSVESLKLLLKHPQFNKEFLYMFTDQFETARMVAERMCHTECERLLQEYAGFQREACNNFRVSATHLSGNSNTFKTCKTTSSSIPPAFSMHNFNTGQYHTSFEPSAPPMYILNSGQNITKPPPTSPKIPECYVCFEEMKPPLRIKSCTEGHALCEQCLERMKPKRCGQCKSVSFGRATTLEQFIKNILDIE